MSYRNKAHVTEHKESAERKLAQRVELLKSRGLDDAKIEKDSFIKKLKADNRKFKRQLLGIANQEKLNAELAQAKADKLEAKKNAGKTKAAKPAPAAEEKKPKKEKKPKAQKEPASA